MRTLTLPVDAPAAGKPAMGGVAEPERPYVADVGRTVNFPSGNVGRPPRQLEHVVGYAGFRPLTTPIESFINAPAA